MKSARVSPANQNSHSAHTAYAGFSSLAKLAALYVVQISNEQLDFVKCLLIRPHDACLFAAGTVALMLTQSQQAKIKFCYPEDIQLSTYKAVTTTRT
jgi:hypothetical protein